MIRRLPQSTQLFSISVFVCFSILLTACGGGSNDSNSSQPPSTPPVNPPPESPPPQEPASKWTLLEGFPTSFFSGAGFSPEGAQHSPVVVDIDGVAGLEILQAATTTPSDPSLNIFTYEGERLSGWPSEFVPGGTSPFTVANFGEMAVVGGVNTIENDKAVFATNFSGTPLSYFQNVPIENYVGQYPASYDVDGDGFDEVFIGDESGRILALNRYGQTLSGWENKEYSEICSAGAGQTTKSIAFGDLNGDGNREILIVAGFQTFSQRHCLMAFEADGKLLENFPIVLPFSNGSDFSIVVGNVDDDSAIEIVYVDNGSAVGESPELYVISNTGEIKLQTTLAGDLLFSGPFPSLADLDNDGANEVLLLGNGTLNVTDGFGSNVQGFPITFNVENLPSIGACGAMVGDITGDQEPEIVFCARELGDFVVHVYGKDGTEIEDSPLTVSEGAIDSPRGVVIADIDEDGQNELVIASEDTVWAFKYGENIPSGPILWGQFGNDAQRSNLATIDR